MLPKKLMAMAIVCAAVLGTAAVNHGALAQEHAHRVPVIVTPTNGAIVSNPVSVAFAFVSPDSGQPAPAPQGDEHRPGGMLAFLVIDAAPPAPGAEVQVDPQHVPFPKGQTQLMVSLAPGQHQLQLVFVDREGKIARHFHPGGAVTVTVK